MRNKFNIGDTVRIIYLDQEDIDIGELRLNQIVTIRNVTFNSDIRKWLYEFEGYEDSEWFIRLAEDQLEKIEEIKEIGKINLKLYEILNEKYLGKKFRLIKNGIEGGWIRTIATDSLGKYGYVTDNNCIWSLNEGDLLCNVELIKTEEEKFKDLISNYVKIIKKDMDSKSFIVARCNYDQLKNLKENEDIIYMEINNHCIGLSLEDFDKIANYVEKLKELKRQ